MQGIHIKKFLDRLRNLDSQRATQYVMTIHEARELHGDITKLLLDLKNFSEALPEEKKSTVNIEVQGGSF